MIYKDDYRANDVLHTFVIVLSASIMITNPNCNCPSTDTTASADSFCFRLSGAFALAKELLTLVD